MKIAGCNMLIEVVARDEGDVKKNKIIFHKLKTLKLSWLSSLTNFCVENYTFEFPALEELEVFDCTKMKIFCPGVLSTPKLNKVYYHRWTKWIWEDDLNTSIQEVYRKINERKERDAYEFQAACSIESSSLESKWRNAKSSEEDGAGPSTQHLVLQNAESSKQDGSGLSTQHLVLQNEERSKEDGAGPSTQHLE
ncbi:hypothetical protein Dsin_024205 [Dipteronia sinensis]|uniref:Uncharacterized protein n=1 Tax=Dipteronia sinensis TaxID=43782 RepID=A0AAE0A4U6_9ROSI|nr:hypothetical protein Dsin_024205 [Dipteronia sinensis]